jgi:aminocarboxymuconate-semialdehyde decarboxylase
MRVVDFHDHFYPPEYLERLTEPGSAVRVTTDDDGNPCLHYPGDYNVVVPGHRDIAHREEVLEREGVDLQVLSLTTPGTHVEEPGRAVELARLVNDAFAEARDRPSRRFTALATLPLNDPGASADELERAMDQLGLPGAMVFSNVNGEALWDDRFLPLWERADELGAIVHVHPTAPVGVEAMKDFWLMPLVGFLFDTTLAASGLVFRGIPQRFPNIRWVLGHLGGALPYIAERLDRGYRAFPACRRHIDRPPSDYLKRFHYDGVNFDPRSIRLAIDFAGATQVVAGSDYPHQIGSIAQMIGSLESSELTDDERTAMAHENADRLLGIGEG